MIRSETQNFFAYFQSPTLWLECSASAVVQGGSMVMAIAYTFLKAISDLFTMLDTNKDGEIDKIEQEAAMKKIHSMTLPKARWEWIAMDTDGDGKISEREFQEGMQAISDKVGEEQLLDCIIRAWPDHPLALEER